MKRKPKDLDIQPQFERFIQVIELLRKAERLRRQAQSTASTSQPSVTPKER